MKLKVKLEKLEILAMTKYVELRKDWHLLIYQFSQ